MRFQDYDPEFALLKLADGKPVKITAGEAPALASDVFEFNETLYNLLLMAYDNGDAPAIDALWAAAQEYIAKPAAGSRS